jgi:galactonate dehydratase
MTRLRASCSVPFAIGEEFSSKWQAAPYLDRGLVDFLRVDVCNIGGLTEAMKAAAMAELRYVDLMPHNPLGPVCTAATVHFCAAIPNLAWSETHQGPFSRLGFHPSELFPTQMTLEHGAYAVPDGSRSWRRGG